MRTFHLGILASILAVVGFACGGETKDKRPVVQHQPVEENINPELPGMVTVRDKNGGLVADNTFANKDDVYLFSVGLTDGVYFYEVNDPGCNVLLAGPAPSNDVPDTADRILEVKDGGFTKPVQIAPFADTPNSQGRYVVSVLPVNDLQFEDVGCFGFPDDKVESAEFRIPK